MVAMKTAARARRLPLDLKGMTGREEVFRVAVGKKRDPAVERWFAGDPAELRTIAAEWFARIRDCGDDVLELVHDGCPIACIEDAPFAYVNAFKSHVNVGFFNGAALEDPAKILLGSGKRMRHVKIVPGGALNADALAALIGAAYADIKARLSEA
jgi:hypothetical protein